MQELILSIISYYRSYSNYTFEDTYTYLKLPKTKFTELLNVGCNTTTFFSFPCFFSLLGDYPIVRSARWRKISKKKQQEQLVRTTSEDNQQEQPTRTTCKNNQQENPLRRTSKNN